MTDHPMSNPVSVGDDLVKRLRKSALPSEFRRANPTLSDSALAFRHSFDAALKLEAASQLAAVTAANKALMAERVSIIATKRKQIASLMDERNNLADIVNSGIDDVAGAKLDELEERATTAEAQLKAAREALEDLKEGKVDSLGDFIALADAALNPKAPS